MFHQMLIGFWSCSSWPRKPESRGNLRRFAYNPGWMWDQGMMDYTWLPYDGMFMDPFGFGFYSPWYLYGGGFIYPGYGFGGGYYGRGYPIHGPYRGGTATAPGRGFLRPSPWAL